MANRFLRYLVSVAAISEGAFVISLALAIILSVLGISVLAFIG